MDLNEVTVLTVLGPLMMRTLGISAFYHDSAAALVQNGEIVAAAQEERYTRVKHDSRFPTRAIEYCLAEGRVGLGNIDLVAFYEKPFRKFHRLITTYLALAPRGIESFRPAMSTWLRGKLFQRRYIVAALCGIDKTFIPNRLIFAEHHQSHAASAFFPSPFDEAVVLSMDGVGEWATTSVTYGSGNQLMPQKELHFPHSLGMLYSAFTAYTGFKVNDGEYKLMGLAPYGEPKYLDQIFDHLVRRYKDASIWLDMSFFNFATGLTMTTEKFHLLFGGPPRCEPEPLEQRHMDIAASIQMATEMIVSDMCGSIQRETNCRRLCIAGGVALNCVVNGKILRSGMFDDIWIQPAGGDAGGAVGAAFAAYHQFAKRPRIVSPGRDRMQGGFLGPSFSDDEVGNRLTELGAKFVRLEDESLLDRTVEVLISEGIVGWVQGRMEFGPRALGNRSILGDPRSTSMQRRLNLRVKRRESFRPFAPAVLREHVSEWFDIDHDSPYMLFVAQVIKRHRLSLTPEESALCGMSKLDVKRSTIPAVTHVDDSARIQTVDSKNERFHSLLVRFYERSGCPVLINTSFNVRGEPIVLTPDDAFRCFMCTEIDVLVIGNYFLEKAQQVASFRCSE